RYRNVTGVQTCALPICSSVLKITNGPLAGRVWFKNGDLIDAETQELTGETAFRKILSWKTGNFEILPAEPERNRTISNSYQGLRSEERRVGKESSPRWC